MGIDFEAARKHLKQARTYLQENEGGYNEMTAALDLMIINLAAEECSSLGALLPSRRSKHAETRNNEPRSSE